MLLQEWFYSMYKYLVITINFDAVISRGRKSPCTICFLKKDEQIGNMYINLVVITNRKC